MKTVYTMSMEAILAVMNISILSSSENEAWNTVSLYGILTHDLYDTGVALATELKCCFQINPWIDE